MKITRKHIFFAVCLVCLVTVWVIFIFSGRESLLKIYFLDIGQGDSIYIRSPSGEDMLIDVGPNKSTIAKLAEVMPFYDHALDVVIETHPDADHIGGFPEILERYDVGLFLEPGIESKNAIDDEINRIIERKNIKRELARRGMSIYLGREAYFEILFPDKDVSNAKNTNDASVIGKLNYGSTSVMLTGDASVKVENYLISLGGDLRSDILKAGHHGSKTSTSRNFLEAISPKFAIISAGVKNRYGHPHREVIDRLKIFGVEVSETAREGTVEFVSDGKLFRKAKSDR